MMNSTDDIAKRTKSFVFNLRTRLMSVNQLIVEEHLNDAESDGAVGLTEQSNFQILVEQSTGRC